MNRMAWMLALAGVLASAAAEAQVPVRASGPLAQPATRSAGSWERIRLKHLDVRVVAALFGAYVLPTEGEVLGLGYGLGGQGTGARGMGGPGMGGFGGMARGGFGGGMGPMGGGGMSPGYGAVAPFSGGAVISDRNNNRLIMRPGAGGPDAFGPRYPLIADPNSNSLLVRP